MAQEDARPKSFERRVFDSLYGSSDFDCGINESLALIGNEFRISRVYVFENDEDDRFANNTFEWCAPGIEPQIDELQNMSYEEYGYDKLFSDSGVFACPDTADLPGMQRELMESQGIRATIQCAIYDKGQFRGFVGFDDCARTRPDWSDGASELDALAFLSQVLSVYLVKERNLRRAEGYHARLLDALAQAKRASRAKTDFFSRMSHDIRTPLNGIIGMTEIARQDNACPEVEQSLKSIADSSTFLLSLINDILDISKIESGKLELKERPVPLPDFDRMIRSIVVPLMQEKGISFDYRMECGMTCAVIDPVRFNQIFINLLGNAAKFTPKGGHVLFGAQQLRTDNVVEWVRFTVQDDGAGMSAEFADRAFGAFEQDEELNAKVQNQGTGLGLAICKQLTELMGGSIAVESALGQGTTFTVDLPLKYPAPGEAPDEALPERPFSDDLTGRRILLVEDNDVNATIAKRLIEAKGGVIERAENGKEALDLFARADIGTYDAILMDVRMPVMDGYEATCRLRQLERADAATVPIIAMTANAFDEDAEESLKAGMDAHVAKPVNIDEFFKALSHCMSARQRQGRAAGA